jgi:hypothetical protein
VSITPEIRKRDLEYCRTVESVETASSRWLLDLRELSKIIAVRNLQILVHAQAADLLGPQDEFEVAPRGDRELLHRVLFDESLVLVGGIKVFQHGVARVPVRTSVLSDAGRLFACLRLVRDKYGGISMTGPPKLRQGIERIEDGVPITVQEDWSSVRLPRRPAPETIWRRHLPVLIEDDLHEARRKAEREARQRAEADRAEETERKRAEHAAWLEEWIREGRPVPTAMPDAVGHENQTAQVRHQRRSVSLSVCGEDSDDVSDEYDEQIAVELAEAEWTVRLPSGVPGRFPTLGLALAAAAADSSVLALASNADVDYRHDDPELDYLELPVSVSLVAVSEQELAEALTVAGVSWAVFDLDGPALFDGENVLDLALGLARYPSEKLDHVDVVWRFDATRETGGPMTLEFGEAVVRHRGVYYYMSLGDSDGDLIRLGQFGTDSEAINAGKAHSPYSDEEREEILETSEADEYGESEDLVQPARRKPPSHPRSS